MTNGTAAQGVTGVARDGKIRQYGVAGRDALKSVVRIAVDNPHNGADGPLQTARINGGIDSTMP